MLKSVVAQRGSGAVGALPYPPGEGDKEARDRQLGLGVLEGTGC